MIALNPRWLLLAMAVGVIGCRGEPGSQPPIHFNPNMDTQDKYKPFRVSTFFKDGNSMRTPPAGTVARGFEKASDEYWRGMNERGDWVGTVPGCSKTVTTDCVKLDMAFMKRGQERYDIFCAPCHDAAGTGKGLVALRKDPATGTGIPPVPTYHDPKKPRIPMGQLFHIIGWGERSPARGDKAAVPMTMKGYRAQIPVADRWAIAAYVAALQLSQRGK